MWGSICVEQCVMKWRMLVKLCDVEQDSFIWNTQSGSCLWASGQVWIYRIGHRCIYDWEACECDSRRESVSCSSDCWSKPVTANLKGSNRTSLQLKGGTTHATYIRISLKHFRICLYPSPKLPQIEGWNFVHCSAVSLVILCKVMKIMWFEEANFKLSSRINSHTCGDRDVADTRLSLKLPSNKRDVYLCCSLLLCFGVHSFLNE